MHGMRRAELSRQRGRYRIAAAQRSPSEAKQPAGLLAFSVSQRLQLAQLAALRYARGPYYLPAGRLAAQRLARVSCASRCYLPQDAGLRGAGGRQLLSSVRRACGTHQLCAHHQYYAMYGSPRHGFARYELRKEGTSGQAHGSFGNYPSSEPEIQMTQTACMIPHM